MDQPISTSYLSQFKHGLYGYKKAFQLVFSKGFKQFLLFPLLAIVFFWALGFKASTFLSNAVSTYFFELLTDFHCWEMAWLKTISETVLWVFFRIIFFLLFAYIGGFFILILLSPVLSFLSEKVEEKLTGRTQPFSINRTFFEMVRGAYIALRNLAYQLILTVLVFLLTFFPPFAPFMPLVLIAISAYFYGFAFLDYYLERSGLTISQGTNWIKRRKVLAATLGLPFVLVISIPFVGSYLAAFFVILATIAATAAAVKES